MYKLSLKPIAIKTMQDTIPIPIKRNSCNVKETILGEMHYNLIIYNDNTIIEHVLTRYVLIRK